MFRFVSRWVGLVAMIGLLAATGTQAQIRPVVSPGIVSYKPGSYQLLDGKWYAAQLYTYSSDAVRVRNPTNKFTVELGPDEVRQFVLEQDTFSVLLNVPIPGQREVMRGFAKNLYRCGDFRLLEFRHTPSPASSLFTAPRPLNVRVATPIVSSLLVQPRGGNAVRVPSSRGAFEKAMLPLFGECPEVAEKIRRGKWGQQHMKNILLAYAQWQQTSSKPSE